MLLQLYQYMLSPRTGFAIGSFKLISQTLRFWHIACVAV